MGLNTLLKNVDLSSWTTYVKNLKVYDMNKMGEECVPSELQKTAAIVDTLFELLDENLRESIFDYFDDTEIVEFYNQFESFTK
jgi:hypothetical protein